MNLLFLDWGCFGKIDAIMTFEAMGFKVFKFAHPDYLERRSPDFIEKCTTFIKDNNISFCFSFNFYPLLAQVCHETGVPYVSLVYDSPQVKLYSYTIIYPECHVYIFDRVEYEKLQSAGINTVHYSILPVNSDVIDIMLRKPYNRSRVICDVSFVGALYNEQHNFFDQLEGISDYTRGILEGLMEAQLQVQGYSFIEEMLASTSMKTVMEDIKAHFHYDAESNYGVETLEYVITQYTLARRMTSIERQRLLTAVAEKYPLKLFTLDKDAIIPNAINMGITDYYGEMPLVFNKSKINLNITLRSIRSGIPLRCMDIMGNGGFLLTNFQSDLLEHFRSDEDFVYYEDQDDLVDKVGYYLKHDSKRENIARHGRETCRKYYNFRAVLENLLKDSGIKW